MARGSRGGGAVNLFISDLVVRTRHARRVTRSSLFDVRFGTQNERIALVERAAHGLQPDGRGWGRRVLDKARSGPGTCLDASQRRRVTQQRPDRSSSERRGERNLDGFPIPIPANAILGRESEFGIGDRNLLVQALECPRLSGITQVDIFPVAVRPLCRRK
jgi:hypothetical protein